MNDGHLNNEPPRDAAADIDLLLSRAVSGDRDALSAVRARGASEPALLDELAMWQADELRLARAAREITAIADRVEPPEAASGRARTWRHGIGWGVAALIALAWISQSVAPRTPTAPRESVAGFPGFASSDAAYDAYLEKARADGVIFGDVAPPTIIGSRELAGGEGFEVLIMRQIVERRKLPELYRVVPVDETGRLAPIVIRPRTEEVR